MVGKTGIRDKLVTVCTFQGFTNFSDCLVVETKICKLQQKKVGQSIIYDTDVLLNRRYLSFLQRNHAYFANFSMVRELSAICNCHFGAPGEVMSAKDI